METRYLNTLVATVETGTFSKAAEVLHITQSAVSQRIKFLEEHFGQQLFDRSGQKLALTDAGRVVAAKAREILDKEQELLACLQAETVRKRLSLCCTPTFGMAFLSDVLNAFLLQHSDLSDLKFVFMQPDQALRGLRDEEFDLAVIEHRPDQDFKGFERYAMPDDEMLFVLSSDVAPGKDSDMIALKDLMEFRLFARRDGCSSKELLRSSLQAQSCDFDDFDGMVTSDDLRFTIQTVLDGNGAAFLSKSLISEHLASGDLTGLRVEGFEHQRGRSVVMLPQRREDALIKELLECLFAVVSPFWRPQALNSAS